MTRNDSTIGRISLESSYHGLPKDIGYTLELPWRENRRDVSHIPSGQYIAEIYNSQKFGRVLKFLNMLGRTDILMHPGNFPKDTKGCPLPGKELSKDSIRRSREAMSEIMSYIDNIMLLDKFSGEKTYIEVDIE
jgi:hypothetical protein